MKFIMTSKETLVICGMILGASLMMAAPAQAKDLMEDFDSLGGNDALLEKARALNPEVSVRVVQDRVVNRRNRIELAPEFSGVIGGDAYNSTQNIGANLHFHLNPRWSLGLKYNYAINHLRSEAKDLIQEAETSGLPLIPDIDFPKQQAMAFANWYPIFGKMNLYDLGVAHFDLYVLAGAGQIELRSGRVPTYSAGGGVGFWVSQYLSARMELRYQTYQAKQRSGAEVGMNTTVMGLQVGYLL